MIKLGHYALLTKATAFNGPMQLWAQALQHIDLLCKHVALICAQAKRTVFIVWREGFTFLLFRAARVIVAGAKGQLLVALG